MTTYTPHLNLDLYEGTDPANLTDQYNAAMGKLDTAVHAQDGNIASFSNTVSTLNQNLAATNKTVTDNYAELTAADASQRTDIDQLIIDVANNKAHITENTEGVQQNTQAVSQLSKEMEGLGITSVENAESFLATVNGHTQSIESQGTMLASVKETADDALASAAENQGDIVKKLGVEVETVTYANNDVWPEWVSQGGSARISMMISQDKNWWGVLIHLNNTTAIPTGLTRVPVPGFPGRQGFKTLVQAPAHIAPANAFREGLLFVRDTGNLLGGPYATGFLVGSDRYFYLDPNAVGGTTAWQGGKPYALTEWALIPVGSVAPIRDDNDDEWESYLSRRIDF